MNRTTDVYVKCPFFESERGELICCEGHIKNTVMTTRFADAKAKRRHLEKYCFCEDGGKCPMAVGLFARYKASEEKTIKEKYDIGCERLRKTVEGYGRIITESEVL